MAGYTREIYDIKGNYKGYGKFSSSGDYLGSAGGKKGLGIKGYISTAGARGDSRNFANRRRNR